MRRSIYVAIIVTATSVAALAAPPEGTKLSEIIAKIEQTPDMQYIDEVDWNDHGYYEIEYFLKNGTKIEVKIDPKTGESVR
ncbi:PepSY domain-containing protein [Brucella gallinifaecis]|uniref:PepSY domain-containing protein n=1 Tax=Brucella gallinifaecis TaxID=215590 RepID=A0A502BQG6_9HYPH|nr:PepSY domain-containing protein [Brucella gallinifaecis]TPF75891.1 PepSY domain-containing protein [Brucella gallinifaecis]